MTYNYMPISIALTGRPTLVVGGGQVALRKIGTLLDYGCEITVVAPEVADKIQYFADSGRITLHKRKYESPEAGGYRLVISACDETAANRQVSDDCRKAGVLVNVVDQPALCDFIFPAVIRRDCLTAAVSTDGKAPFMAGHLRLILEDIFPSHWNKLMPLAVRFRKIVQERWKNDLHQKTVCFAQFLEADWKSLLKEKNPGAIDAELEMMLHPRAEKPAGVMPIEEPSES
ncbi:MAG: bifunctional precorrin-2 dehydrogenase/sirohydrochlorin ferrochelatase [Candidatus Zixiibacteriota bacterium]